MSRKTPRPTAAAAEGDPFRPWLLAGTVALFVGAPLAAQRGDDRQRRLAIVRPPAARAAGRMGDGPVMRRGGVARWGALDLVVLFLVVWHGVSAVVAMRSGAPRPAINAAWQWVSLATMFFLVRQLVADGREFRAIAAVMVAMAVTMSAYGFHQFFYSIPRDQARFRENPETALQEAHVAAPPGSRQRLLFEQRVNSSEPMATFALANSLAGFLVPWSLVGLGICATASVMRRTQPASVASRGPVHAADRGLPGPYQKPRRVCRDCRGHLATGVVDDRRGSTHLAADDRDCRTAGQCPARRSGRRGGSRSEVLSEAGKSLGYRWQYWQATLAMIKDHPLFGCGPGQFQGYYTHYMRADASETVADPHNFLLEVAATAGLPSAAALLLVIGLVAWRIARPAAVTLPEATGGAWYHVYIGAAAGFLFAFAIGPLATVPLGPAACVGGLLTSGLAIAALEPWVRGGRLTAGILGIAAAALLVNLLAGGGINFAGVAGSLWLPAGLCLASRERWRGLPVSVAAGILAAAICLSATFYFTVYRTGAGLQCRTRSGGDRAAAGRSTFSGSGRRRSAERRTAQSAWRCSNGIFGSSIRRRPLFIGSRPRLTRRRGSIPIWRRWRS